MSNILLDLGNLIGKDKTLGYINYETLKEDHKEFLRSDMWDLEFIEAPHAVYFPGNTLLKARTTGCTPSFGGGVGEIEAIIRQFRIRQTVISGTTSGTISVQYMDREDQAIRIFLDDWRDKIWNRNNRFTFRKEDTIATLRLTQYNSTRKPLVKYIMYACQINGGQDDIINKGFTSDDPSNIGDYDVTYSFEHYELEWCNLPA